MGVRTVTFAIRGVAGVEIYRKAPPIPAEVVAASGEVLMTKGDIMAGQAAWQSTGGMQLGSLWGHGAYQAPDWSADWVHRALTAWLSLPAAASHGKQFHTTNDGPKAAPTPHHRTRDQSGNEGDELLKS